MAEIPPLLHPPLKISFMLVSMLVLIELLVIYFHITCSILTFSLFCCETMGI